MMAKRGIKPRFTREEVLSAAVELFDDPAAPFTMKLLADHLGIGVMTLYGYVANKEDLLDGVSALIFDHIGARVATSSTWQDQLRKEALGIHEFVVSHPRLADAMRNFPTANPGLFRLRERILQTLHSAGFEPRDALRAMGIVTSYAQGFASVQAATPQPHLLPDRIRQLPAEAFPRLHQSADIYATHISDDTFRLGLDLLIDGLQPGA
jgi:AcrR family transcriptional regulator